MRLTGRIVFFVLALGIATAVFAHIEGWRVDRDQQQQLKANVTDLQQLIRQFAVLPAILASDPRLSDLLTSQSVAENARIAAQVNAGLRTATDRSDAAFAFLMDKTGLTVAASNYQQSVSFVGQNYGFRPYFTKAMEGRTSTYFAVGATTGIRGSRGIDYKPTTRRYWQSEARSTLDMM